MPTNPTSGWDTVPVYGCWENIDGTPKAGKIKFTVAERLTRADGSIIFPHGGTFAVTLGGETGSISVMFPASDDPDIVPNGWQVKVDEQLTDGSGQSYYISTPLSSLALSPPGVNLANVVVPPGAPSVPAPLYVKGIAGGVAALDATTGQVLDASGSPVTATTDASALTAGTLPAARLASGSVTKSKLVTAVQDSLDKADAALSQASATATYATQAALSPVATQAAAAEPATHAAATYAPLASPAFTGTPTGITKAAVGLGSVDNTADTAKPVSTAQAAADAAVAAAAAAAYAPGSTQWMQTNGAAFSFAFTAITASDTTTGLPTAATVRWPDGTSGAFTGTIDSGGNGYSGYTAVWGAKTLTASGITYDATTGVALGPTGLAVA